MESDVYRLAALRLRDLEEAAEAEMPRELCPVDEAEKRQDRRLQARLRRIPKDMICPTCWVCVPDVRLWCASKRECLSCSRTPQNAEPPEQHFLRPQLRWKQSSNGALRKWRGDRSQKEVAEACGVSIGEYSKIETKAGKRYWFIPAGVAAGLHALGFEKMTRVRSGWLLHPQRLKQLRESTGIGRTRMAERSRMGKRNYLALERGRERTVDYEVVARLVEAFRTVSALQNMDLGESG